MAGLQVVYAVNSWTNQKKEQWLTLQANSLPLVWWKSSYFYRFAHTYFVTEHQTSASPCWRNTCIKCGWWFNEEKGHRKTQSRFSCQWFHLQEAGDRYLSAGTGFSATLAGWGTARCLPPSAIVCQFSLTACPTCCHTQKQQHNIYPSIEPCAVPQSALGQQSNPEPVLSLTHGWCFHTHSVLVWVFWL